MVRLNRVGQKYGRLTVVSLEGKDTKGRYTWLCKCDCGNNRVAVGNLLGAGKVRSCGCLDIENRKRAKKITHGKSKTHVYKEWRSMLDRCSPKYHGSNRYYERGIKVCDEWKQDFSSFFDCVSNLEHYGEKGFSLDRIDNNGNYEPSNVRWATPKEQQNNTRNNILIEYMGKTQTMKQWCEELGINYGMVKVRHQRGWIPPKLFETPHKNQYS